MKKTIHEIVAHQWRNENKITRKITVSLEDVSNEELGSIMRDFIIGCADDEDTGEISITTTALSCLKGRYQVKVKGYVVSEE